MTRWEFGVEENFWSLQGNAVDQFIILQWGSDFAQSSSSFPHTNTPANADYYFEKWYCQTYTVMLMLRCYVLVHSMGKCGECLRKYTYGLVQLEMLTILRLYADLISNKIVKWLIFYEIKKKYVLLSILILTFIYESFTSCWIYYRDVMIKSFISLETLKRILLAGIKLN